MVPTTGEIAASGAMVLQSMSDRAGIGLCLGGDGGASGVGSRRRCLTRSAATAPRRHASPIFLREEPQKIGTSNRSLLGADSPDHA